MADDPTIEEALRRLEQTKAAFSLVGGNHHVSVRGDDLRTLLASHASLEERVKEAPEALRRAEDILSRAPFSTASSWSTANGETHPMTAITTIRRALAAFVNEKET